jgi:tetratricopeptide (TPR) repeat protein
MQAGERLEAKRCCQRALARDAAHADTLHLMGMLCLQDRQFDEGIEWIARANHAAPAMDYLIGLGTALEQQALHEPALKAFDGAVKLRPGDPEGWTRHGNLLALMERPVEAILSLQQALKANAGYWTAANNCAALQVKLGQFEEALASLNLCDALQPGHAPTLEARASTFYALDRFEEALSDGQRAQVMDPANAHICNNIGAAMRKLMRHEAALAQFERALALRPDFMPALSNKASVLNELERFDEALAVYRQIKAIDPDDADADWNAAHIQLLHGEFEAGWSGWETRWRIPSLPGTAAYPKFSQPMWRGERDIAGKTVLVCADEGLGDTIQFVRYVPMLAALGARVILLAQEPLYPLLSRLPGVAQCLPNMRGGLPAFDLHCPIMSLPAAFATTSDSIPAQVAYVPPPDPARMQAWDDRLGGHEQLRVGLVWSGNPRQANNHKRSIPLRVLSRLLDADATFVSLQKDPMPGDRVVLRELPALADVSAELTDFAETAALISRLDLVITVCTSVAHLAATLGRPTWILLPTVADWRWLRGRDDSPWYPSVRLFRQTTTGDYAGVAERVRTELQTLVAASRPAA